MPITFEAAGQMSVQKAGDVWRLLVVRVGYLALPVYVCAVLIWRFALGQSWLLSFAGVPLGLFIGGLIYSIITSNLIQRRRAHIGR